MRSAKPSGHLAPCRDPPEPRRERQVCQLPTRIVLSYLTLWVHLVGQCRRPINKAYRRGVPGDPSLLYPSFRSANRCRCPPTAARRADGWPRIVVLVAVFSKNSPSALASPARIPLRTACCSSDGCHHASDTTPADATLDRQFRPAGDSSRPASRLSRRAGRLRYSSDVPPGVAIVTLVGAGATSEKVRLLGAALS